ncbi:hypothetical protein EXIGLDRAFT_835305 [Exidia glandulosa HHB12029]|uniref:Uncharacterized protein n=1 Tax=Exidia glandulosa HHB12029 TaxID=1314781 RepID=A0A165IWV1_EXIGL|nr:hypothetical protein EXIGLDRAFT_835305 [Exidia glandulosa HHB12029]
MTPCSLRRLRTPAPAWLPLWGAFLYPGDQQPAQPYGNVATHRAAWWLGMENVQPPLFAGDPRVNPAYHDAAEAYYRTNRALPPLPPPPVAPPRVPAPPHGDWDPPAQYHPAPAQGWPPHGAGHYQQPVPRPPAQPRPRAPGPVPNQHPPAAGEARMVRRPRPVPIGDILLDNAIAGVPAVIWKVDVHVPVVRKNVELRERLALPSNMSPTDFRAEVCRKMGLDYDAANLGFKTSKDRVKDAPRPFNTEADVREAISCIAMARSRTRTATVDLHIIDLDKTSAAAAASAAAKQRGGRAQSTVHRSGGIATSTTKLNELEEKLLCHGGGCKTPRDDGKKFCLVDREGKHIPVSLEARIFWASRMAADPENVTVDHPPATLNFDHRRSQTRKRKRSPTAAAVPNITINITEPSTSKRRRVFGTTNAPIDLTGDDDDVKVKVEEN